MMRSEVARIGFESAVVCAKGQRELVDFAIA